MSRTFRNWHAVDAHFRSSAGPMKPGPRGGAKNRSRDYLLEAEEEEEDLPEYEDWFKEEE